MYSKILVPLDGSKLAESVLPHVEAIASGCGSQEVILVSVTEQVKITERIHNQSNITGYRILDQTNLPSIPMQDTEVGNLPSEEPIWTRAVGKQFSQADKYLDRIQRQLIKKGLLNVKTEVLCGKTAESIVDYAEKMKVDLIMMTSHGRSGISRWASGSTTDKVFRSTCVPILMVRAPGCIPGV